ncbi:cytoskeletal protein RodZ [Saccharothrix tamanrassetensis]|uniref:Cytoskeletal protein RodZ n=1 Tax=Saccharothrix tamanrassetensis TaxID=1051531 RepID=A0A841CHK0_9PSEU|nr:hypothetical protein [Saccharothrix tamanrassetensis]MBB5955844.1 cytoskeletal protein RodZ [Saccharothrix tamanrassetensis]
MRVLWAASGLAVAASALTGVLIGVYIDGMGDRQKAEPPASTWITTRSAETSSAPSEPPKAATTDPVSAARDSTTSQPPETTTTTTPPPPVQTAEPTTQAPRPSTTTSTKSSYEPGVWPCHPLNLNPPPQCPD